MLSNMTPMIITTRTTRPKRSRRSARWTKLGASSSSVAWSSSSAACSPSVSSSGTVVCSASCAVSSCVTASVTSSRVACLSNPTGAALVVSVASALSACSMAAASAATSAASSSLLLAATWGADDVCGIGKDSSCVNVLMFAASGGTMAGLSLEGAADVVTGASLVVPQGASLVSAAILAKVAERLAGASQAGVLGADGASAPAVGDSVCVGLGNGGQAVAVGVPCGAGVATSCCATSDVTRWSLPLKTSLQLPQRTRPPRNLS